MSDHELYLRCLEFVREQSSGEWGDEIEKSDAKKLAAFVREVITATNKEA